MEVSIDYVTCCEEIAFRRVVVEAKELYTSIIRSTTKEAVEVDFIVERVVFQAGLVTYLEGEVPL